MHWPSNPYPSPHLTRPFPHPQTALLLSRLHSLPTILLERSPTPTPFPKMEYSNGRTMEIYRAAGLASPLRTYASHEKTVPNADDDERISNDELIVSSVLPEGKLLQQWHHAGAAEQRRVARERNDGGAYVEPHLRCHQIVMERWLRERVEEEKGVEACWGCGFVGLREEEDKEGKKVVISEATRESDGAKIRVKSSWVVGCDGGGSWVRKSVGLESRRNYM